MVSMSAKGKRVRGVLTRLKREREVKIRSAVSLLCSGSLSREKYHFVQSGKSLRCHLYMKVRKVARVMRKGTEEKVKLARAHSLAIQRRTLISPPRIPSIALIKGISHAYSFKTLIEEGH